MCPFLVKDLVESARLRFRFLLGIRYWLPNVVLFFLMGGLGQLCQHIVFLPTIKPRMLRCGSGCFEKPASLEQALNEHVFSDGTSTAKYLHEYSYVTDSGESWSGEELETSNDQPTIEVCGIVAERAGLWIPTCQAKFEKICFNQSKDSGDKLKYKKECDVSSINMPGFREHKIEWSINRIESAPPGLKSLTS